MPRMSSGWVTPLSSDWYSGDQWVHPGSKWTPGSCAWLYTLATPQSMLQVEWQFTTWLKLEKYTTCTCGTSTCISTTHAWDKYKYTIPCMCYIWDNIIVSLASYPCRLSPRAWVRGYYETHCISAILYYIYNYCFGIEESISHAYVCHYCSILYEGKV